MVKVLLQAGADPELRDYFGQNAYDVARKKDLSYILERAVKENSISDNSLSEEYFDN